jgi:hypothetical protein
VAIEMADNPWLMLLRDAFSRQLEHLKGAIFAGDFSGERRAELKAQL